ncbi:MAG: amidohydrolase family protein [Saprospiraceae bacterium]
MKFIYTLLLSCIALSLFAQRTPAARQSQPILITGATIHIGNGQVIENGVIAFEDGSLSIVGDQTAMPTNAEKYQTINASGKHIYPGLIAPNSQLGLVEIGAVRSTRDSREVGNLNPNIRSIIAYNTDSKVTPTIRSNGVLLSQITPQGGRIPGQSSIVELDGWNWEDAAYATDDAIHLNWPGLFRRTGWWGEPGPIKKNDKYAEQVRDVKTFMQEAKAYSEMDKSAIKEKNLKFEAMRGLFDGSKNLMIHANLVKTIQEATLLVESMGIQPIFVGGRDSWMITDFLKKHQVEIILAPTQDLPAYEDSDVDQPFKTAGVLQAAGISFAFSGEGSWQQRNLMFQAGQSVGFGLDYEAAISALTLNTAKILNIADKVGSLETGKDATLIVVAGDVLDMRTNKVEQAFIRGKQIDLGNKQKDLYKKFEAKYEAQR